MCTSDIVNMPMSRNEDKQGKLHVESALEAYMYVTLVLPWWGGLYRR